jgi:hypothetical protein
MTAKLPGLHSSLPALRYTPVARPLRLFEDQASLVAGTPPRRRRIWEVSTSFHCSIIGTCLTTAELRQILLKIDPGAQKETDHELHGRAVLLAGQKGHASKLLQKALDRRHRSAINQLGRARNADEVRLFWEGALQRAEIPGAYWTVLTHPETTEELVRRVFGEVHMLSHLVGAANRADIRRLRELESENAALRDKVTRQQRQLRDAVVARDATIANLNAALGKAMAAPPQQAGNIADALSGDVERATTSGLIADLQRRLSQEVSRRERMERRVADLTSARDSERRERSLLALREQDWRHELEAAELSLSKMLPEAETTPDLLPSLHGAALLYVGGRPHQLPQLRRLAEQWGATFVHHDGGVDDRSGLLESLVAGADLVLFPVDCVSHNAVAVVKRVSRNVGKRFVALRSSGLTAFVTALRSLAARQQSSRAREQQANSAEPLSVTA